MINIKSSSDFLFTTCIITAVYFGINIISLNKTVNAILQTLEAPPTINCSLNRDEAKWWK